MELNKNFISEMEFFISKHGNLLDKKFLEHVNQGNADKISRYLKKMKNYIPSQKEIYNILLDRTLYEIQQKFDMAKDAKKLYLKYKKRELQ